MRKAASQNSVKQFSPLKWFRNISISKKLYFVLGLMAVLIALELGTLFFAVNTLSSVRAFVGGEGLWSKAQKDAIFSLRMYARVENDDYYNEYLEFLKVPLGDRKARIEMAKPNPDYEIIRQGFLEGRNHPDDIDGMVKLFRRFYRISYINKAIHVWAEADTLMAALQVEAEKLHNNVQKKDATFEEMEENLDRINELNKQLTIKEDEFSATLGEGSRWLEGLVLKILFLIALTVEVTGLILTIIVSRDISKGINETMRVVKKVASGNFDERAKVFSKDEIGQLTESFNQMTDDLERNINDRKKAEDTLIETRIALSKKAEEKFRGLLETAPDAMVIVDEKGKIMLINAQTEKLFGYNRSELINKQVEMLIPERFANHKSHRENYFQSPNARPMGRELELFGKNKNGIEFPVEISLSPLKTDEGVIVSAAIRDITERKRANQELKESEEKFNKAFKFSPAGVNLISAVTGKYLDVNDSFLQIIGFTREEVIGKTSTDINLVDTDTRIKMLDEFNRKGFLQNQEIIFRNKSGQDVFVLFSTSKITVKGEDCLLTILYDITERKLFEKKIIETSIDLEKRVAERTNELTQINKKLESTNLELESFAYITSHDLKAPLRAIGSLSDWLYSDYSDKLDATGKEQLLLLKKRVSKMHDLIEGILHYSRIGRLNGEKELIDTHQLIKDIKDLIQIPSHIKIITEKQLPVILNYRTNITQLFENLLTNAVKYCDKPEGIIKITCDDLSDAWRITVNDNGPGIDKKYHTKIFEIFQTLKTNGDAEGTGIGLTIVKKIVESSGGQIRVESELGLGTTFIITLPK